MRGPSETLSRLLPEPLIALVLRLGLAATFFMSGRSKVEGLLHPTDGARFLFADVYNVPLLPPEVTLWLTIGAEHLLPLLLAIGLFTRLSALGLLGMTLVIQIFVVPTGWPTHLLWLGPMLYLIGRGAGPWSLDRRLQS